MSLATFVAPVCALGVALAGVTTAHSISTTDEPTPRSPSQLLSVSASHNAVIDTQGRIWSWGNATEGRLGATLDVTMTATPVQAGHLTGAVSVGAANTHTLAATADGQVWIWGSNSDKLLGTAVEESIPYSAAPIRVPELTDVVSVAASDRASYAVTTAGLVYAWGGSSPLLGDGGTEGSRVPVEVQGPTDVVTVSAAYKHTLALTGSGEVWAWGNNSDGQLGTASTDAVSLPMRVEKIPPMTAIAAGEGYSMTVDTTGAVWAWGWGMGRILQHPDIDPVSLNPVRIPGLSHVVAVAASEFALAITGAGDIWTWGYGGQGQLGHASITSITTPTRVDVPEPTVAAAISNGHAVALATSGTLYTWGANDQFQLGDQSSVDHLSPGKVGGMHGVVSVGAGAAETVVLAENGDVYTWGENWIGQLGNGTTVASVLPTRVIGLDSVNVKTVDVGNSHMLALSQSGDVFAWGANYYGQLGNGSTVSQSRPVRVEGLPAHVIQAVAGWNNSAAVTQSGELWTWGANPRGQLGNGTYAPADISSHPIKVEGLPPIASVAIGGSHMVAIDKNGDLWTWGDNRLGQLGIGDGSLVHPSPMQVGLPSPAESVACGGNHTIATLKSDEVFAWGDNSGGSLGIGSESRSPTPVQVQGIPGHGRPFAGNSYSLYLTDDGAMFAWGMNSHGQLGDGTGQNSTVPRAVSLPRATHVGAGVIHAVLASSIDGEVYTWGRNSVGQLGYPESSWSPTARVSGLDLGTFELPGPGPTVDPTEDPSTEPTEDPTGEPTEDPT
ncbi:MAG: hypothetical protein LBK59_05570, partial [Bifidobacteriaceae bacterium]|nr:hypothetical protein [Bifidobacteriaceae bacterium]